MARTKKQHSESAADAATGETKLEKCAGCHAYFVEPGTLCDNCRNKE